jgi:hypothetical protein
MTLFFGKPMRMQRIKAQDEYKVVTLRMTAEERRAERQLKRRKARGW